MHTFLWAGGWAALWAIRSRPALLQWIDLDMQNEQGETLLHHACLFKYLLDHGSNPNHKDSEGQSPLFHATAFGHGAIVEILLDAQRELLTVST